MSERPTDPGDVKRGGLDSPRSITAQWIGLVAPPAAWLLNLEFGYSLAHAACHGSGMLPVHVASVAAIVLAALGGLVSLSVWRRAGGDWPDDIAGATQRARFMATLGLGMAVLFVFLILSQWLAAFIFHPCWRT